MGQPQRIALERRAYNQWVADQTLEDFALRFTATSARKGAFRIGNTALGAISFLACEAIGGSLTLAYGTPNVVVGVLAMAVVSFLIGLPIIVHAARAGVDVDLLTRGAGFGYLGSTITSLIYASFTFVLFSIEASILSVALEMVFGIPLWFAHILSALVVIPIAAYGIRVISKVQMLTQPIWLILQVAPLAVIAFSGRAELSSWAQFPGLAGAGGAAAGGSLSLLLVGSVLSILLSLLPQIGEQVDYLRFLPARTRANARTWWAALLISGPGWVVPGAFKLILGSFLCYLALSYGIAPDHAAQPAEIFNLAFSILIPSPAVALVLTGIFVAVCQIKINVTNAYAGSIAWSNFFSRLTHSHPGRVVWLVFNVMLALLLMEIGFFRVIESVLGLYANFAVGWMGALVADLVINKPLGLSPRHIEFKRAHLYDINPVGTGAMALSVLISTLAFLDVFGPVAQALCALIGLVIAFVTAPLIAWATGGRYYLARQSEVTPGADGRVRCAVCENAFEPADMAHCTAYAAPICSLCCTLEARCHDLCKRPDPALPPPGKSWHMGARRLVATRLGRFAGVFACFVAVIAAMLGLVHSQYAAKLPTGQQGAVDATLWIVFFILVILSGISAWLMVLSQESRRVAENEFARQAVTLMQEIEAHERTDAALQRAKEAAESANYAKSRYIVGLSHEIRSPLNSIFGYAQLLENDAEEAARVSGGAPPATSVPATAAALSQGPLEPVRVIRRSAQHLSDLVDGLLDISRIESGTLVLDRDRVNLHELLDQMAGMFALQARDKGIAFRYSRGDSVPAHVHADEKRLRQILINLLSNAVKFTAEGEVALTVRWRNSMCSFEISDTGMGVAPADHARIFQPFERGSDPPARAIPGTGLGLTITKLLVEIMGGTLEFDSQPGEGSRVVVRLLLFGAGPAPEPARAERRIRGYAGPRRRVLTVDDAPEHLELMRRILVPLGFDVLAAQNGEEALRLSAAAAPDLALLDVSMPGMSGWDLAARLREGVPGMRIIMVSANAHDRPARTGSAAHDAFLAKPFERERLLALIATLLGLAWVHEGTAEASGADLDNPKAGGTTLPAPLPDGSEHHLAELLNMGEIGYVHGIRAKLAELEAADARYQPLVEDLRGWLARFDFDGYLGSLRKHLE